MLECSRYSGASEFGFRISNFGFQSIDKEGWSKWPVAECFARHLLNRAETQNSQNASKPKVRVADCFPTSVTLSEVKVLYLTFGFGLQDVTRGEGEMETRGNSRVSLSSVNAVALSSSGRYRNEVCYSEVKGSGNDPAFAEQTDESRRNANHFQISFPDRSSISTLSLSSFRMHGKTNSNERIPIKRLFTN